MDVDGSSNILQPCTHLERMCKFSAQLSDVCANRVDTDDDLVVATGRYAYEAAICTSLHCQRTSASCEREFPHSCGDACLLGFIWCQADADDFRFCEADGWDTNRVKLAAMASNDFGDHLTLC